MEWLIALLLLATSCESAPPLKAGQVPLSCDTFLFRGCPFVACVRADIPGSLSVAPFGECVPK